MRTFLIVCLICLLSLGGFYLYQTRKNAPVNAPTHKLKVVASFSILADIIRNIGRDHVEVSCIVGPNADAHVYQPTPQTSKLISKADLVVINGLGFEGWIERLIRASGYQRRVVIATQNIPTQKTSDTDGRQIDDPHAWNSIENVIVYVQNITQALQETDPIHAADYEKYGEYYIDQLRVLDAWMRQEIEKIPVSKRKVITAHDAFQYLGTSYGITFLAPVGISTEDEPSAKMTAQLIDQIKKQDIRAVFVENIANTKLIEMIAKEADVNIDGVLYSDALSDSQGDAPNFIAMMRHNMTQLIKGMLS